MIPSSSEALKSLFTIINQRKRVLKVESENQICLCVSNLLHKRPHRAERTQLQKEPLTHSIVCLRWMMRWSISQPTFRQYRMWIRIWFKVEAKQAVAPHRGVWIISAPWGGSAAIATSWSSSPLFLNSRSFFPSMHQIGGVFIVHESLSEMRKAGKDKMTQMLFCRRNLPRWTASLIKVHTKLKEFQ